MSKKYKIALFIFAYMYFPIFASEESKSFQNISIHSDQVTFNQDLRQLVFKNNIEIKIDSYTLRGSNAILNSKDQKLEIFGSPASIKSAPHLQIHNLC